jgi:hypothetical protein
MPAKANDPGQGIWFPDKARQRPLGSQHGLAEKSRGSEDPRQDHCGCHADGKAKD